MSYQETVAQKRLEAQQQNKTQADFQAMVRNFQQVAAASLAGTAGKSTVILTDQTDLGEKIGDISKAITAIDTTGLNKEQLTTLQSLKTAVTTLTEAVRANKPDNSAVVSAIKALKLDVSVEAPVVNVPQAKVTVQAPKVDLTSLNNTLKEYFTAPKVADDRIDLDCYRASDIIDGDIQYVGFLNPQGDWYIIENDVKGNKMRYVFGSGNYAKAWAKAPQYEYRLLDEAINAA